MAFAEAMNVSEGTSTSSSGSTPATSRAGCRAAVPVDVATAKRVPTAAATMCSSRSTKGPTEETHSVSRHSLTYCQAACPRMQGTHNGMKPAGAAPGSNDVDTGPVPPLMCAQPLQRALQAFLQADFRFPAKQGTGPGVVRQ